MLTQLDCTNPNTMKCYNSGNPVTQVNWNEKQDQVKLNVIKSQTWEEERGHAKKIPKFDKVQIKYLYNVEFAKWYKNKKNMHEVNQILHWKIKNILEVNDILRWKGKKNFTQQPMSSGMRLKDL